jgi:hypothetical protein
VLGRRVGGRRQARQEAGEVRPGGPQDLVQTGRLELAGERPKRLDERREGQVRLGPHRAAPDDGDRTLGARLANELADEPRLPDAGLATQQDDGRLARTRAIERRPEAAELRVATDEG